MPFHVGWDEGRRKRENERMGTNFRQSLCKPMGSAASDGLLRKFEPDVERDRKLKIIETNG